MIIWSPVFLQGICQYLGVFPWRYYQWTETSECATFCWVWSGMASKMVLDERLINFEWKKVVPHLIHKFQIIVWNMILSNRIKWLFDHQYFYKESVNILDFFHRDSTNEQKLLSVLLSVGCGRAWQAMPKLGKICQRCFWVIWVVQTG